MRLLLDTHIWIWSHVEPERLSSRVAAALESPDNELWLSPISTWEFLLLVECGRLRVDGDVDRWLDAAWSRVPMHEATLTREVARRSRTVAVPHDDPADRFLAAAAQVFDLTPVTDDANLLQGRGSRSSPTGSADGGDWAGRRPPPLRWPVRTRTCRSASSRARVRA